MTKQPLSRQRVWQIKMIAKGRCMICGGKPSETNKRFCNFHRDQKNTARNTKRRAATKAART